MEKKSDLKPRNKNQTKNRSESLKVRTIGENVVVVLPYTFQIKRKYKSTFEFELC